MYTVQCTAPGGMNGLGGFKYLEKVRPVKPLSAYPIYCLIQQVAGGVEEPGRGGRQANNLAGVAGWLTKHTPTRGKSNVIYYAVRQLQS